MAIVKTEVAVFVADGFMRRHGVLTGMWRTGDLLELNYRTAHKSWDLSIDKQHNTYRASHKYRCAACLSIVKSGRTLCEYRCRKAYQ